MEGNALIDTGTPRDQSLTTFHPEHIGERKHTRQIVIITDNPNLVVTTDSEQIIICNFDGSRAPRVQYRSGALENTSLAPDEGIREEVCHLLEGGVDAFRIREHRYDLPE
jgi:hypothetical protein